MTSFEEAADKVTVNVALPPEPDSVYDTSLIDRLGVSSSSVMVSVPVASLMVALLALDNVSVAVSLTSSRVSANTGTLNVCVVFPARIVTVPVEAV